jgi:hypothetical protein
MSRDGTAKAVPKTNRPEGASTLPKAGVKPEGRKDLSIDLVLALAVARSPCKPQKTQQKHVSSPKIVNSLKTKQIKHSLFAYEFPPIRYN